MGKKNNKKYIHIRIFFLFKRKISKKKKEKKNKKKKLASIDDI